MLGKTCLHFIATIVGFRKNLSIASKVTLFPSVKFTTGGTNSSEDRSSNRCKSYTE